MANESVVDIDGVTIRATGPITVTLPPPCAHAGVSIVNKGTEPIYVQTFGSETLSLPGAATVDICGECLRPQLPASHTIAGLHCERGRYEREG